MLKTKTKTKSIFSLVREKEDVDCTNNCDNFKFNIFNSKLKIRKSFSVFTQSAKTKIVSIFLIILSFVFWLYFFQVHAEDTAYGNPTWTWNRSTDIIFSYSLPWITVSWDPATLIDGIVSHQFRFTNSNYVVNWAWMKFEFSEPRYISEAYWHMYDASYNAWTWKWQWSNDDSSWTDLGEEWELQWTWSANFYLVQTLTWNWDKYKYYRVLGTATKNGNYIWLKEVDFKIDPFDNDLDWVTNDIDVCLDTDAPSWLVSYWGFEEWEWTIAYDSYWSNTWTINWWATYVWGKLWSALLLDWADDEVVIESSVSSELSWTNELTVSAWIYLNSINWIQTILSLWTEIIDSDYWFAYWLRVWFTAWDGKLRFQHHDLSTNWQNETTNSGLSAWQWYLVTLTFDNWNRTWYVDWDEVASTTLDNTSTISSIMTVTDNFRIWSSRTNVSTIDYYFDWIIDDLAIYNTLLTSQEISTIYNNWLTSESGQCPAPNYWNDSDTVLLISWEESVGSGTTGTDWWTFTDSSVAWWHTVTWKWNATQSWWETRFWSKAMYFDWAWDYLSMKIFVFDHEILQLKDGYMLLVQTMLLFDYIIQQETEGVGYYILHLDEQLNSYEMKLEHLDDGQLHELLILEIDGIMLHEWEVEVVNIYL